MKYDFTTLIDRDPKLHGTGKYTIMVDSKGNKPPKGTVPLSVADMEFRTAPCIIDALHKEVEFGLWGYHIVTPQFREACCDWMKTRHDWCIDPEWIVPIEQGVPAMYVAIFAFTEPGDKIVIQTPGYYHFEDSTRVTGRTVVNNQLIKDANGKYVIDYDDLAEKAKGAKMMFLCSPHNPTGRVFTAEELKKIGDICLENNVLLFDDEIHHDLIMPGYKHTVYATLGEKYAKNCLICTSLSKTFNLAGLCFASMIIPNEEIRKRFQKTMATHGFKHTSRFGPVAHEAAYRYGAEWLDECIQVIEGNYQYFKSYMAEHFPGVKVYDLEGTYLSWFDCSCFGMSDEEMKIFLTDTCQLYLDNGPQFGPGGEGCQRINLACPRKILEDALDRFTKGIKAIGRDK